MATMTEVVSSLTAFLFAYEMLQRFFPDRHRGPIRCYIRKLFSFWSPFIHITFHEYDGDNDFERSTAYQAISRYLNTNSTRQAEGLVASVARGSEAIVLSMSQHEEVVDEYQDIKLWWTFGVVTPNHRAIMFYPRQVEKKFFKLRFHRKHRDLVTSKYLKHVLAEGEAISIKERSRKLYTNNKGSSEYDDFQSSLWSHVVFEHPATFEMLAMEPVKKQEIMDDLLKFSQSKDYYAKIGKAWKRGYLLYGPPGTGKSTTIAAMANLLKYDVYDLELTAVKDNSELRKLLIDTSSKSLIVIEDIDCLLELTRQRTTSDEEEEEDKKDGAKDPKMEKLNNQKNKSQLTLSGLLNFIDGLWSARRGERIIVFTTNHVEKLDPALIRRGRMDKHIEMTYCGFEAFKVLAKNYLGIHSHDSFPTIQRLLEETDITPADVAEILMPKSFGEDEESCLERLIKALEEVKEDARRKAENQIKVNS